MSEEKQYQEAFGALPSEKDIRDYKLASVDTEFPESFELEMPPVKNQLGISSCVAHALAIIIEYYLKQQHGIEDAISTGYIYANRDPKDYQGMGMITKQALSRICKEGSVFLRDFPYNEEVPDIINRLSELDESAKANAIECRFTSYVVVSLENEIKTALIHGAPIVIVIDWYDDMKVKNGILGSKFLKKKNSHCMVLYGWDKNGWKIQNSWGEFWGDGGKASYPYEYPIKETYAILDDYIGNLNIKKPFKTDNKISKFFIKIINKTIALYYGIIGTIKKKLKKTK